ncbi:MAG: Unknown protein [uncultured Sulfurovum sp.]|uniref:Yip1 domain-containing protein n=1 Tax=uncultured Sulfurovum sp. TaxID=269237 RepID=A0A6S6TRA9_9BACT|nr:MAG: Unknown protein [uncultured Sulfurovum sp.]
MNIQELLDLASRGVISPKSLWNDKLDDNRAWSDSLKSPILTFVGVVAVLSAVMIVLFGYQIPFIGVVRPTMGEIVLQAVGSVILYVIPISIMSWVAVYLSKRVGGIENQNRAIWMLFLVSIPSLLGQAFATVPMIGLLLSLGLGIYSMVLFYKAIPIFMEVPLEKRLSYFILMILASIVVSLVLHFTLGQFLQPSVPDMGHLEMQH